jgi:hypothetical protein
MAPLLGGHLVVENPIALHAVALREEDIEAKGLQPLCKLQVVAPLRLPEQWSCEVDQHARHPGRESLQASSIGVAIEHHLQHVVGIQLPQAQVVAGRLQDRLQWRQAD